MDGPYPRKIRTATMLPQGGILLRYHRPIRCTPTSTTRCISRPSTSKEASTGFRAKATISRLRRKPYTNSRSSSTPTAREIYFKPARTMISHILIKGKLFQAFPFIQASPPAIPRSRRTGTGSGARPRNASPFRRSSWRGGSYPSTRNRRHGRGSASSLCA